MDGIVLLICEIIIVVSIYKHFKKKKEEKQATIQDNIANKPESVNPTSEKQQATQYSDNSIPNKKLQAYSFSLLPVNDKGISKSRRNVKGTFRFENEEYVAIAYDNSTANLLLFQKVENKNNAKTYTLVEYGYLWMKLYKYFSRKNLVLPTEFDNIQEMPEITDEELNVLWKNEKSLREAYGDIKCIELAYSDGTVSILWKIAELQYDGKTYHFMAHHTDDETEIHKVASENGSEISYEKINDATTEVRLWEALIKSNDITVDATEERSAPETVDETNEKNNHIENDIISTTADEAEYDIYNDDILIITDLREILKINSCDKKAFALFDKMIEFSKEKMSFVNLLDYCTKLKKFSIHKFEEEWQKTYIANDEENFDRNMGIISDIFANIYSIFDSMWKSIGYEKTVESILDSYQIDSLWARRSGYNCKHTSSEFIGVTDMYLSTAIGKLNMYNYELQEALRKAKFEAEFNKPPKHTGSWVGGGFGLKGALKGVFTAAALNAVESTIVNVGRSLNHKSVSEETLDDIKEMKRNIEDMHKKVTEKTLVSDINVIVNALFMATTIVANTGFSYQRYLNNVESARKGLSYNTDLLVDAINAYPFGEKHYDFIEQHFREEEKNLSDIRFHFKIPPVCYSNIDFVTIRKNEFELTKLLTMAYTYEENRHFKEAIGYYRQMLEIDSKNEIAIKALARLNATEYIH